MFTRWTGKEILKAPTLPALFMVLTCAAMYPGYFSPVLPASILSERLTEKIARID